MLKYAMLAAVLGGACTMSNRPEPKSWTEHEVSADAHDQRAAQHDRAASAHKTVDLAQYQCGDLVANDQVTSGGEPLTPGVPCWDPEEETVARHRALARHERAAAQAERVAAVRLVNAERVACAGISEDELGHSPFVHKKEIAQVLPHYAEGRVRGARVDFKAVPGLTSEWLKNDIACHMAHFHTMGDDPNYLPEDPTLVPGARTSVDATTGDKVFTVTIEGESDDSGAEILARAQALTMLPSATTATR